MVYALAFHPDGERLVSGDRDGTLHVWDVSRGTSVLALRGHEDIVRALCFSPDGERLLSASDDGTARQWNSRPSAALR